MEKEMEKKVIEFIRENNLSPFNQSKSSLKLGGESIYQTKDAKIIHNKVISSLSSPFHFADTGNLFGFFCFASDINEIKKRQEFFSGIDKIIDNGFLKEIKTPKQWWKPKYGIIAVTENEKTFNELQKLGCPVKYIINEMDLDSMEDYDIVQVIDCENFSRAFENLPQSMFLDSVDEVYLERYVQLLSGWKSNIDVLRANNVSGRIGEIVSNLYELFPLMDDGKKERIKKEDVENAARVINSAVSEELKKLTVSGDALFKMLSKSTLPEEMTKIVKEAINSSDLPSELFVHGIPVEIDELELDKLIKKQNAEEHTTIAEKIKRKAQELRKVPELLNELSDLLLYFDFTSGLSKYINDKIYPENAEDFVIDGSSNLFLNNAQAISFNLNSDNRCSILTGANSGGKTTLLEHIIQLISLYNLGLPVSGKVKIPGFSEVYYFAKNKGSLNKGAFETLLTQMSKIKPGKQTLILADEIESVTEPGVAGAIVSASADFFIKQGCFMVIATHLGKEIEKKLPQYARVDGIEAKGLDEFYELIVDHNPVLGRLANSTPELIVEKMANSFKTDYFNYLYRFLRENK
jgi:hypothetical protein